jgi:hypothetical protein
MGHPRTALIAAVVAGTTASAATVSFRSEPKAPPWPKIVVKRDPTDPREALEARVFLHQVTNPERRYGGFLNAKEVAAFLLPSNKPELRASLASAMRISPALLMPGRYEVAVRVATKAGRALGEGVFAIDEAAISKLVTAERVSLSRASGPRAHEDAAESEAVRGADPGLAVLDRAELARLPSETARRTAQVFAYVLATRDAEVFHQLVGKSGLETDNGRVAHEDVGRTLSSGLEGFLGPAPKAPWRVQFSKDSPSRFTMKPSAQAATTVTFAKGDDGAWRVERVMRKANERTLSSK